jgi:MoaA/NifB/PqqE/SkfB family radical SAM enzyme
MSLAPAAAAPRALRTRYGPAGVHLFDRASGINVLLDEFPVPPEQWSRAPRQFSIALTNACDLDCAYCYAPKTQHRVDFQKLCGWLGELDAHGCIGIGFGGGEPTLYPHLVDLCRWAIEHTNLAVTMTTHGHHLRDDLLAALAGNIHFVRVSMDGVETTYEALRGRSFAQLVGRLRALRSVAPFGLNFVVNATTIADLPRAVLLAHEWGASEFLLLPQQAARGLAGIDPTTQEKLHAFVHSYRGLLRLAVSEQEATGLPVCDPLASETGLHAYAHLDAAGVLRSSSYSPHGVPVAGSLLSALAELRTTLSP